MNQYDIIEISKNSKYGRPLTVWTKELDTDVQAMEYARDLRKKYPRSYFTVTRRIGVVN